MQTLFTWWRGRSEREQRLLIALGAIFAAFVVWFGFVLPLASAADNARVRHEALVIERRDVRAAAAQLAALSTGRAADGRMVKDVVSASAAAAGLEFSASEPEAGGGVLVTIAAVRPTFLFGWIAALEAREGVVADRVSVQRNEDATVSAQVGFPGRGS